MSKPIIEVEGLSKSYQLGETVSHDTLRDAIAHGFRSIVGGGGERKPDRQKEAETLWALKDVSFQVNEGDVLGIIGRNGAGKSTLLKILSRITGPTSGTARIRGRVASLLEVGTGFHPELTGRENIFMNGAILGMTRQEMKDKFDEIVAFAEVERFIDTPVKRYSSGMYVRLAFAVAAHINPEILIVDEVLAVGDMQFQKKCLGKMQDVGKEGRTVLFVSHNLTAVRTLCNKAVLFQEGRIIANGNSPDVVSRYTSGYKETILFREWVNENGAPHNDSVVLKRITICDDKGKQLSEVYTDTAFNIEIEYYVNKEDAFVGLTLVVYDAEDNCVFSSINNGEQSWYGRPMSSGIYTSTCKVPANFLNNGIFSVSLFIFGRNFTDVKDVKNVLKIDVIDGMSLRRDYFGDWSGVVRPDLEWRTNRVA